MKKITFWIVLVNILINTNHVNAGNWAYNSGTSMWEKNITPDMFLFSNLTTTQLQSNLHTVIGAANPNPSITSSSGQNLSNGYFAVSGGQISTTDTNPIFTNTKNGFNITNITLGGVTGNYMRFASSTADISILGGTKTSTTGYFNLNWYIPTQYTYTGYLISFNASVYNPSTYGLQLLVYDESGAQQGSTQNMSTTGWNTASFTQTSIKPFRFKMSIPNTSGLICYYKTPEFLLKSATEPTVRTITVNSVGAGSVANTYATVRDQDVQIFTITPVSGQTLLSTKYNGSIVTPVDNGNGTYTYTTPLLTANAVLNVEFSAIQQSITGGTISSKGFTETELAQSHFTVSSGELNINQLTNVHSITVSAGAKLSVASGQALTLTNLTLQSNASGTSTFVNEGTLTVTGTATVEQYLATTRNWYVSSPVTNANAPSGYTYYKRNEPGGTETGWTAVSAGAGLTAGIGYIALPNTAGAPITFTTQGGGTLNSGDITIPLTYTPLATSGKGFNLIGNPYPAHLTWTKAFVDDLTNAALIEPTIYYRTNAGTANSGAGAAWSFITYNASTDEGTPALAAKGIIPPMQAFWVKAKATGNLILDNKLTRSHQTSNPLKAPALKNTDRQRVRLQVSSGTRTDETLLLFDANAADGYDVFDSPKFTESNSEVQIYTSVGNEKLVMNGMKTMPLNQEIAIGFVSGNATSFSLRANEITNLPNEVSVILKDNATNTETDLTDGLTAYQFAPEVTTNNRFSLIFRTKGVTTSVDNWTKLNTQVFLNAANQITIIAPAKSKYIIYNAMGQLVENGYANANRHTIYTGLASGVYIVSVNNQTTRVIMK